MAPTGSGIGSGSGSNSGGSGGLLDDPQSLLAAMKHSNNEDEQDSKVGCRGDGEGLEKLSSATTTAGGTEGGGERGRREGIAAALRLNSGGRGNVCSGDGGAPATAKRDILLPGALAGFASGGGGGGGEGTQGGNGLGQSRRGPLISEIEPPATKLTRGTCGDGARGATDGFKEGGDVGAGEGRGRQGAAAKRERTPAVKKGFLSAANAGGKGGRDRAPLYPPGGSENGSEPSAYVKLMSRCKVVDTRDHSKGEV